MSDLKHLENILKLILNPEELMFDGESINKIEIEFDRESGFQINSSCSATREDGSYWDKVHFSGEGKSLKEASHSFIEDIVQTFINLKIELEYKK